QISPNSDGVRSKRRNLASKERAEVVAALLRLSVDLQPPKAEIDRGLCMSRSGSW
ncbi:hypothetical protein L917_11235, partial [Phytophthora nicotianae]